MKKTMKIMLVAIMLLAIVVPTASVLAVDYLDPSSVVAVESEGATKVAGIMNQILGIVQVVAISVAVIMLIVLGIKYISAAPGEKADIKKGAMIYVVGAALLFGSTAILEMIKKFAAGFSN